MPPPARLFVPRSELGRPATSALIFRALAKWVVQRRRGERPRRPLFVRPEDNYRRAEADAIRFQGLKPVTSCGKTLIRLMGHMGSTRRTHIISCRATVRQNKRTVSSQTP